MSTINIELDILYIFSRLFAFDGDRFLGLEVIWILNTVSEIVYEVPPPPVLFFLVPL